LPAIQAVKPKIVVVTVIKAAIVVKTAAVIKTGAAVTTLTKDFISHHT